MENHFSCDWRKEEHVSFGDCKSHVALHALRSNFLLTLAIYGDIEQRVALALLRLDRRE